jgi:hypothetical protein
VGWKNFQGVVNKTKKNCAKAKELCRMASWKTPYDHTQCALFVLIAFDEIIRYIIVQPYAFEKNTFSVSATARHRGWQ